MSWKRNPPEEIELPEVVHITPSRINPWRGAKTKGARFTHRQLAAMADMKMDPATIDETGGVVTCRSVSSAREIYVNSGESQPVYVFDCPILEIRPNGFRLVISPRGINKIVHESGRLKRGQ